MWITYFSIGAPFGSFRNPYTTIYKQSYPFPTKPAIVGMLGAMLGWDEATTVSNTNLFKIGIPKWKNDGQFVEYAYILAYKGRIPELRPERFEILVRPSFEILVASNDKELIKNLFQRIKNRNFEFPIYMGRNEFIISEVKVLSEEIYEQKLSKVSQPMGIIFIPGNKIPTFYQIGGNLRPPQVFIGVPLELSLKENQRELRKVCTALAVKEPIRLAKPVDGFKQPYEISVI